MKKGFTLIEIIIVAALLGILAAIIFPALEGHIQRAKESAAKVDLRILRNAIEYYAAQHKGFAPGYFRGVLGESFLVPLQLMYYTKRDGNPTGVKSDDYPLGPLPDKDS